MNRAPLRRYQVMSVAVGVGLIVLVFVAMPLRYLADFEGVSAVVGPLHGFLYIVYLVTVLDVTRSYRLSLGRLAAMVGAGLLPFLAFVVERRMTRTIEREQLAGSAAGPLGDASH